MLLLALDTSGSVGAALHDGSRVLAERSAHDPRRHAELLVPFVDEVLREAGAARGDLTALAVGVGPGPFTGLRVGLVTAVTLGHALGVRVHGLCSLDALAAEAVSAGAVGPDGDLVVATDARRREVYWARYAVTAGQATRVHGPHVGPAADVDTGGAPAVGRGAALYRDALAGPDGPLDPSAAWVSRVVAGSLDEGGEPVDGGPLLEVAPLYLRRPDAQEPVARKRVLT